jgi:leader peptidase (prepilin peptidase)/N-methyltransferase
MASRSFSSKVDTYTPKKMRQDKDLEHFSDSAGSGNAFALRLNAIEIAVLLGGWLGACFLLPLGEAAFSIGFWFLVVIIVKSDLADYLIPDWASLGLACLGLAHAIFARIPGDGWFDTAVSALSNGGLAFGLFFSVRQAYYWLTKRDGLGFGDVKLAGALGLWLDFTSFALSLQLAAIAALILVLWQACQNKRDRFAMLPLGAFLAPSAFTVYMGLSLWPDFRLLDLLSLGAT